MSTSSTITEPAVEISAFCPEWCTGQQSDHRVLLSEPLADGSFDVVIEHPGPMFGPFLTEAQVGISAGTTYPAGQPDSDAIEQLGADAAGLRQLAADALAAAEWMESVESVR